jgi:hypothetical protein
MTVTTARTVVATVERTADDRVERAALRLYEAEVALHAAHQTKVDAWICAAGDRLHEALLSYDLAAATGVS